MPDFGYHVVRAGGAMSATAILFFLDLVQDVEILSPLVRATRGAVWITDRLDRSSPNVRTLFETEGIPVRVFSRIAACLGFFPDLKGFGSLVTAAETSARPHRPAHLLTRRANARGLKTHTIQHGLENIGLTYFDRRYTPKAVRFASKTIFIWGKSESLHPDTRPDVKARCVSAGCPKEVKSTRPMPRPQGASFVVSVFENLHWDRYTAADRERFLNEIKKLAKASPRASFIVKPHPDQRWSALKHKTWFVDCPNVALADPLEAGWKKYSAAAILAASDAAITTPSSVALDAARLGVPVAIFRPENGADFYEPLPMLTAVGDAEAFLRVCRDKAKKSELLERLRAFEAKVLVPGDAVARIVEALGTPGKPHAL